MTYPKFTLGEFVVRAVARVPTKGNITNLPFQIIKLLLHSTFKLIVHKFDNPQAHNKLSFENSITIFSNHSRENIVLFYVNVI